MRADRAARIVEEYTTWTVVETDPDLNAGQRIEGVLVVNPFAST